MSLGRHQYSDPKPPVSSPPPDPSTSDISSDEHTTSASVSWCTKVIWTQTLVGYRYTWVCYVPQVEYSKAGWLVGEGHYHYSFAPPKTQTQSFRDYLKRFQFRQSFLTTSHRSKAAITENDIRLTLRRPVPTRTRLRYFLPIKHWRVPSAPSAVQWTREAVSVRKLPSWVWSISCTGRIFSEFTGRLVQSIIGLDDSYIAS